MADYIRREDYCEENCGKENREGYKTCTNCGMLNVPSADVQPIVYAHKTINVGRRSYCSNCGKLAIMEDFCSKCGAKVKDGDTDERGRVLYT